MRIKNSLSPYPILNDYENDYVNSSFTVNYELTSQFTEIYGKLNFSLNNADIQKLIDNNIAVFTAHIECPVTCYRKVFTSKEPIIEFRIATTDLSKTIEIRTFIVLTKNVTDYHSKLFHPDYQNLKFNLSAHQIIAIGTAYNYTLKQDERDLDSLPSIIQITKLTDKRKGDFSVNTDNDEHIIIGLTEDAFPQYSQLGKNIFKSTSFSLILLPALIIVLERMYLNRHDSNYTSLHWYTVIENLLLTNGYSVENLSIETDSLLSICQSLLGNPISKSFHELDLRSERL